MLVRSFQLSDYQQLIQLLELTLSDACYDLTMEALIRQLSLESDLILVCASEDTIIGVIIGTIDKTQGFYYRLAVHPSFHGQGIGKKLIESLEYKFKQRKVNQIMILEDEFNQALLPFFMRFGSDQSQLLVSSRPLRIMTG